jgi:hypothetical protein
MKVSFMAPCPQGAAGLSRYSRLANAHECAGSPRISALCRVVNDRAVHGIRVVIRQPGLDITVGLLRRRYPPSDSRPCNVGSAVVQRTSSMSTASFGAAVAISRSPRRQLRAGADPMLGTVSSGLHVVARRKRRVLRPQTADAARNVWLAFTHQGRDQHLRTLAGVRKQRICRP